MDAFWTEDFQVERKELLHGVGNFGIARDELGGFQLTTHSAKLG